MGWLLDYKANFQWMTFAAGVKIGQPVFSELSFFVNKLVVQCSDNCKEMVNLINIYFPAKNFTLC